MLTTHHNVSFLHLLLKFLFPFKDYTDQSWHLIRGVHNIVFLVAWMHPKEVNILRTHKHTQKHTKSTHHVVGRITKPNRSEASTLAYCGETTHTYAHKHKVSTPRLVQNHKDEPMRWQQCAGTHSQRRKKTQSQANR